MSSHCTCLLTSRSNAKMETTKCRFMLLCLLTAILLDTATSNPVVTTFNASVQHDTSRIAKEWLMCTYDSQDFQSCSTENDNTLLTSTAELQETFRVRLKAFNARFAKSIKFTTSEVLNSIEDAKTDMQSLLSTEYGSLFDENIDIFDWLFSELDWYIRSTAPLGRYQRFYQSAKYSVSPASSVRFIFRAFFGNLTKRLITIRQSQLTDQLNGNYMACMISALNRHAVTNGSSDIQSVATLVNYSMYAKLEQALTAIRIWVNLFLAIVRFTDEAQKQLPITEDCVRAYGAVKMCNRCVSDPNSRPCQDTCETAAQLCTGAPSAFVSAWKQFFDTANEYSIEYYIEAVMGDVQTLLRQFNQNLTSAILNASFVDFQSVLNDSVFSQCEAYKSEGPQQDTPRFEFEERVSPRTYNTGLQKNVSNYADILDFCGFLNETSFLFRSVEEDIFRNLCPSNSRDSNCWNATARLRTSARPRYTLDSVVNDTELQALSLQYKTQFYSNYTILFSEYAQQVLTNGASRAGLSLLEESSCLRRANVTDDQNCYDAELYDVYVDELEEGSASYDDGNDFSNTTYDDEDSEIVVPEEISGFNDSANSTVESTTIMASTTTIKSKPTTAFIYASTSASCSLFCFTCCAHLTCFSILCAIFAFLQ